ncbi:MAG: hypothetical protein HC802_21415, partial [Caldilineaceae bacterium]|nr:hypothetical protein [Caldilineaceae bacterium]
AIMGERAAGCLFGRHDGTGARSTLLFLDHPSNLRFPNQWFMRIQPFACVSFAFMFGEEYDLAADETLAMRYRILFCDGALDQDEIEILAERWQGS